MLNASMLSSKTCEWATPQDLFDKLNAKCARYYTQKQDGLQQKWEGRCWMNPPYGRKIGQWVQKAYESSLQGATVVCLLPARTDTAWWHDFCIAHAAKITFLRGRLKFGDAKHSAPFPSAVVLFDENLRGRKEEE